MVRWIFFCLGLVFIFAFGGCKSYCDRIASYRSSYVMGDTKAALHKIESLYEEDANDEKSYDALVLSLEASQATRLEALKRNDDQLLKKSQQYLARVDQLYNKYQAAGGASIFDYTVSTLTVADAFPYLGTHAELIMTSLYQMLTAMHLENPEEARLFAQRMYLRQQESVASNAENISDAREDMAQQQEQKVDISNYSAQMATMTATMRETLPDTRGYELYVNPFAEYLIAFFHYYYGSGMEDFTTANQCIRRVLGMNRTSTFLQQEEKRFSSTASRDVEPTVYLMHESGIAPSLEERKMMLPIVLNNSITLLSLAYPVLREDENSCSNASLVTRHGTVFAEEICNMDAVLAKEFDHSYASRLTHAITICLLKGSAVALTQEFSKQNSNLQLGALILGNIYLIATNVADTRVCNSFPKAFSMARTTMPTDRKIKIQLDGRTEKEIQLPIDGDVWVVYVRSFHRNTQPVITYFKVR